METKSVLITGCSSGIGKKSAEILKNRGWRVFATARKPEDVKHLLSLGFEACRLDLEDSSSIHEAVDFVLSKTQNHLYGLVNNAGYGLTSAVEDINIADLRKQFEVNVFGLQELTNLLIPAFRKQGHGRIVNISSVVGRFALPYMGAYSASKFALEALTDVLRIELADTGIYVSLVEPGGIKTNFSKNALSVLDELKNKDTSFHSKAYEIIQKGRKNNTKQNNKASTKSVVKTIIHALESKKPRARYLITPEAFFVFIAKKILPETLIDSAVKLYTNKYK